MAQCGLKCKCKWIRIFVIRGFNLDSLDYWPNCFLDYNILRGIGIFEKQKLQIFNREIPVHLPARQFPFSDGINFYSVLQTFPTQQNRAAKWTKIQNPSNDGIINFWILVPFAARILYKFRWIFLTVYTQKMLQWIIIRAQRLYSIACGCAAPTCDVSVANRIDLAPLGASNAMRAGLIIVSPPPRVTSSRVY